MIHRMIGLLAFASCALVLASFALFAHDQLAGASKHQQSELVSSVPTAPGTTPANHVVAQPRRFIDGAARALTSPFRSIVRSNNPWVLHALPAVLALLIYGVGLGFLARYSSGMSRA